MAGDFDLVVLMSGPNPVDLGIARDRLQQAGINHSVRNEGHSALRTAVPVPTQLVVFRKDARRAAEVLGLEPPEEGPEEEFHPLEVLREFVRWVLSPFTGR